MRTSYHGGTDHAGCRRLVSVLSPSKAHAHHSGAAEGAIDARASGLQWALGFVRSTSARASRRLEPHGQRVDLACFGLERLSCCLQLGLDTGPCTCARVGDQAACGWRPGRLATRRSYLAIRVRCERSGSGLIAIDALCVDSLEPWTWSLDRYDSRVRAGVGVGVIGSSLAPRATQHCVRMRQAGAWRKPIAVASS